MQDPQALWREIRPLTGVVDVGLFCDMAHAAYFGKQVRSRHRGHLSSRELTVRAYLIAHRMVASRCFDERQSRLCTCEQGSLFINALSYVHKRRSSQGG